MNVMKAIKNTARGVGTVATTVTVAELGYLGAKMAVSDAKFLTNAAIKAATKTTITPAGWGKVVVTQVVFGKTTRTIMKKSIAKKMGLL